MARNKLEPAPMNMSFTATGNGTNWIDLSQCASILNRRFYRQGLNWAVSGFTVTVTGTTTSPGSVTICKAPSTWMSMNSWNEAYKHWREQQDEVLDDQPSLASRYRDFKIYLNAGMVASVQQTNISLPQPGNRLLPTDCGYNLPFTASGNSAYDWDASTVVIPNDGGSLPPTEAVLQWLGPSTVTEKGIIHGYALSRSRPQENEPNVPIDGGWMQHMFDVADTLEEVRDQVTNANADPPYAVGNIGIADEFYPGGSLQLPGTEVVGYAVISNGGGTNAITAQRRIQGSSFPCGLIEIKSSLPGIVFYDIIVHMVPGPHKGYLAAPMQEM